jgi:hypothetical protein
MGEDRVGEQLSRKGDGVVAIWPRWLPGHHTARRVRANSHSLGDEPLVNAS